MRTILLPLLLSFPAAAAAAERGYSVTDFDRIRVDGPYKVTLTTGKSPGARAYGSPDAIEGIAVELQGRTLIVRTNSQRWGGYPGKSGGPAELRVTTHGLRSAALNGSGSLGIDKVKGQAIDLSVSGSGLLSVDAIEADRLTLGVVGSGRAQVSGKVASAQVVVRGTGTVDAAGLTVADARVGADGPGDLRITATRTAKVASNGTGNIVVSGNPACTIDAKGSGTVTCGKPH